MRRMEICTSLCRSRTLARLSFFVCRSSSIRVTDRARFSRRHGACRSSSVDMAPGESGLGWILPYAMTEQKDRNAYARRERHLSARQTSCSISRCTVRLPTASCGGNKGEEGIGGATHATRLAVSGTTVAAARRVRTRAGGCSAGFLSARSGKAALRSTWRYRLRRRTPPPPRLTPLGAERSADHHAQYCVREQRRRPARHERGQRRSSRSCDCEYVSRRVHR
jgi:hypothetical protein